MSETDDPLDDPKKIAEACELVGRFLMVWAVLEGELCSSIEKLLRLQDLDAQLLCANLQARDKIAVTRAAITLYASHDASWAAAVNNTFARINNAYANRCTIAHNMFMPDHGGVRFCVTKARSKLRFPQVVWPRSQFTELCDTMLELQEELRAHTDKAVKLRHEFDEQTRLEQMTFLERLMLSPNSYITEPGPLSGLASLAQSGPDAMEPPDQATPRTTPQTPPAPPEQPEER